MMPYEKFEAWRVAHELALEVYRVISLGSLSELSYLLRFSKDRGILDTHTFKALTELSEIRLEY
jgi:hypothetical protein